MRFSTNFFYDDDLREKSRPRVKPKTINIVMLQETVHPSLILRTGLRPMKKGKVT